MAKQRYKLRLTKLDFLSLVDVPAQETASIRLIKRADDVDEISGTMKIVKVGTDDGGDDDPLVHCWAFTCTDESGAEYHDLQGDAVTPDFIRAAEEWIAAGGAVDENHTGKQSARISFAYPIDRDIVTAMLGKAAGDATKISGLMAAIRPTADQLAKIRAGEYTGVSIAGLGVRELIKSMRRRPGQTPPLADAASQLATPTMLGKMSALTSTDVGHSHSIDLTAPLDEYLGCLLTSSQTADGATTPHAHSWVYDATTGAVTIGADSGHSHVASAVIPAIVLTALATQEVEEVANQVATDPAAASVNGTDAREPTCITIVAARSPGAYHGGAVFVFDDVDKWLAELPDDAERIRIARLNPLEAWAKRWIAKGETDMDKQIEIEKQAAAAVEITFEKAQSVIKAAIAKRDQTARAFETYVAKVAAERKITPIEAHMALDQDATYRDLYQKADDAQMEVAYGHETLAAPKIAVIDAQLAAANDSIAKSAEAFALAHNMDLASAHNRLVEISPSFRETYAKTSELGAQRDQARTVASQMMRRVYANEQAQEVAARASAAAEAIKAREKPAERKLREYVEGVAKQRGVAYPQALCDALEHDQTARTLYELVSESR